MSQDPMQEQEVETCDAETYNGTVYFHEPPDFINERCEEPAVCSASIGTGKYWACKKHRWHLEEQSKKY